MTQSRGHAPRVDDELKREAQGHTRGAPPGGRKQEWRDAETPVNGEPEVSAVPREDDLNRSDIELDLTPAQLEQRSRLARYLPRHAFPADRHALIRAARDAGAPDAVVDDLHRLPAGETFENPARAWAALGHPLDHRF